MTADRAEPAYLVGDIGGTHARFALARLGGPLQRPVLDQVMSLPGHDYSGLEAAAQAYLAGAGHRGPLAAAVIACAGPVADGAVTFTNLAWSVTERGLAAATGAASVRLINDLAAVAWATPALDPASLRAIAHPGAPIARVAGPATCAVLNAGTGCNASALVMSEAGETVVVGEYGHASFAPCDAREIEIWRWLQARFGRVSIERVLCGPGLLNLYHALCAIEGVAAVADTPAAVSAGADATALRAIETFCAVMGSVAGDVALCYGARGGVFLAGGVAGSLLQPAHNAAFRARFEDKGRFAPYLAAIPTAVIEDGNAALLGAARALKVRPGALPPSSHWDPAGAEGPRPPSRE